ncbi:hypothetical protein F5Y10DRAFT_293052 [Nemania abortiva]|nr:hypothetical protein F5Y10DRAFT_293052 [Nemania abortiva]
MNALSPARPIQELDLALADFCAILTDKQRQDLSKIRSVPDADSILVFTAQLDAMNRSRKGHSVGSRVNKVLQSTRDFCAVISTFVSSNPTVAALVWGSVQLTMQIVVNYTSYYEAISSLFMQLGHFCPLFAEYEVLYPSSTRLQKSLSDFHASIVRCCKHVIEAIKRPWHSQVVQAFYRSFNQEFQPDTDDIRRHSDNVKDAVSSAKAHIDEQERRLQVQERAWALANRNLFKDHIARSHRESAEAREQRLLKEERKTHSRKQRLLDTICAHRPEKLLKQNQRKRFRDTASWIFRTKRFRFWIDIRGPPFLWCSGKIGSGKTVVAASVVDYLFQGKTESDYCVSYFFINSSDRQSLDVETIMRSILRQTLPDAAHLSDETEKSLQCLIHDSDFDKIVDFLQDATEGFKLFYIVIDGVDECEKADRGILLKALSSLLAVAPNTKLFLASRESLSGEIQTHFPTIEQISTGCSVVQRDIATYIHGALREKMEWQELRIGDPSLITEIEQALNKGADGMFLWVFFQVQEICEQTCDEDIRETISNLPKHLEETFHRILCRISSRGHSNLAQNVFPWIAASARPLSLEELREAIAIEIGQAYSKPERMCNDINRIVVACENLVHVDEEDQSVRFAHHSIKQFLVQQPALIQPLISHTTRAFHIDLEEADHLIGEICVTYIDFNDFKTSLVLQSKGIPLPGPSDIALAALGPTRKRASVLRWVLRPNDASISINPEEVGRSRPNNSNLASKVFHAHPFLNYASTHWIIHTKQFQDTKSKTWSLWKRIIVDGHHLALTPWQSKSPKLDGRSILDWAVRNNHSALLSVFLPLDESPTAAAEWCLNKAIEYDELDIIDAIFRYQALDDAAVLRSAARSGHLNVVRRQLAAGVDADISGNDGKTALHLAAGEGFIAIVKELIIAGADIDVNNDSHTALQLAAGNGCYETVGILLAAGADVNAFGGDGSTALQLAAENGHEYIVEKLLGAGAKTSIAPNDGLSSLSYRCY